MRVGDSRPMLRAWTRTGLLSQHRGSSWGRGKTTLLAAWPTSQGRPAASGGCRSRRPTTNRCGSGLTAVIGCSKTCSAVSWTGKSQQRPQPCWVGPPTGFLHRAGWRRQSSTGWRPELIVTGGRWFMDLGASAALFRLRERLAGSVTDARLFVSLAVTAGESGEGDRCGHWLPAAEPLIHGDSDPGLVGAAFGLRRTVRAAFPAAGDARTALAYASRAVDMEDDPTARGYGLPGKVWAARYWVGSAPIASLRLAEARLIMSTDPRAAIPALQSAAEPAETRGWPRSCRRRCVTSPPLSGQS